MQRIVAAVPRAAGLGRVGARSCGPLQCTAVRAWSTTSAVEAGAGAQPQRKKYKNRFKRYHRVYSARTWDTIVVH